ncbi:MAG: RNA-guided endonuclease IscB, partial [Conexivisphaerales archaeon]
MEARLKIYVYVLNKYGNPLMPTSPAKARRLLKTGKAKVVRRTPFTIQLIYGSSGYKQDITLGVDSGYKTIGLSAVTDKQELFASEIKLRTDVSNNLTERRQYRRTRRNRLWYRKPRFDNRVKTKKAGWLAPSILHKLNSHIKAVKFVSSILPVSKVIV